MNVYVCVHARACMWCVYVHECMHVCVYVCVSVHARVCGVCIRE